MALLEQAQPEERDAMELPVAQAVRAVRRTEAEEPVRPEKSAVGGVEEWRAAGNVAEALMERVAAGVVRDESTMSGAALRFAGDAWEAGKSRHAAGEGVAALYGRVNAGVLRGGIEQRSGRVTVEVYEPAAGAGVGIRELDRAFQKDARRYDGGLSLL